MLLPFTADCVFFQTLHSQNLCYKIDQPIRIDGNQPDDVVLKTFQIQSTRINLKLPFLPGKASDQSKKNEVKN